MSKNKSGKSSEIRIRVTLNDESVPSKIHWHADDSMEKGEYIESKALLTSFFNKDTKETMKMDLWTTEMQIDEMDRFFFHTLKSMADTYYTATNNVELANEMRRFVEYFGQKTGIIKTNI